MGFISYFRRILKRPKPKQLDDPTFGLITLHGVWEGAIRNDGIRVAIIAGDAGPTEHQQSLFLAMQQRRTELDAAIEKPLFDEYNIIRIYEQAAYEKEIVEIPSRFSDHFPSLQRSSDIWRIAHLDTVEVYGEGDDFDFCFRFEMDWGDEEHWLSVGIKDWKVIQVGKEG